MNLKKRTMTLGALVALAAAVYGAARHYSPSMVSYVVENTLIQKAPAGIDPSVLRLQFRALLESIPTEDARLDRLLALSLYLEKVQKLEPFELEQLLGDKPSEPGANRPLK